ncbi:MAG: serine hydrolase domain-containing protein [Pyrinomonadaceae bacterium]
MIIKKSALICLSLLLFLPSTLAQTADAPKLPDTVAGRRTAAYIKAFNSGDEQTMRAFFTDNVAADALKQRPVEARLDIYRQMRSNMGAMELRKVKQAAEDAVTVLIKSERGGWFEIGFMFEPTTPHKFLALRVEDADAPETDKTNAVANVNPTATMTEAEMLTSVEGFLNKVVAADEFSGTVLLAKDGQPIFHKAYGMASKEYAAANRTDTKFNLGSINKIFTQIAIGQLVEQGKLSFDDKLGKHLPDYPNRDAAAKVNIRQLLDMSSGIGDFFGPEFDATPKDRLRNIKDFLPLFAAKPLEFEPGTKHAYSNGGYIVLGAIVEKVSGEDYYDYVRKHIFEPAGMQNTDWYEADTPVPNMASGYTTEGARMGGTGNARRNNLYTRPAKGSPAGGGYSTAEDLLKFANALQAKKLRVPNFRDNAAATKQSAPGAQPPQGPGFGIAGGAPGINALLTIGNGYTLIVMSNYDPPSAEKVGRQIRGWLSQVKN